MKRIFRRATPPARLFCESLEPRSMLAVDILLAPVAPLPFGSPTATDANVVAPVAIQASAASVMPVAVVRLADPAYGDVFQLVTPDRANGYSLEQLGRAVGAGVGITGVEVPAGATLELQVLSGLSFWNGSGQRPSFAPVRAGMELDVASGGQSLRIGATTDQLPGTGTIRRTIDIGISDGLPLLRSIDVTIGTGGKNNAFAKPGAPAGIYVFTGMWGVRGAPKVRDSVPVTFVFNVGGLPLRLLETAVDVLKNPATRPVAIVAAFAELVEPTGPGLQFLRVQIACSDPVTAVGRSPRLPIFFGTTQRMAVLDPSAPRSHVSQLTFVYTLTPQDATAGAVVCGRSLRLPAGASLRSAGSTPMTLSLPQGIATTIPPDLRQSFVEVSADISRNTTFKRGSVYVIPAEVHVLAGVTLTIDNGVTVLIRNGLVPRRLLDTAALIFDSGSRLRADTVWFKAADASNAIVPRADNGGVFFLGTSRNASKDGIDVHVATSSGRSAFTANQIFASYLGRTDPFGRPGDVGDDIDAISVLGMGQTEWRIKAVSSDSSGDDGFDVTNSSITLDRLSVFDPIEDGLNISSSFVRIQTSLSVASSRLRPSDGDRELFDLEVDNGPSRVVIDRLTAVDLRGYWGSPYDEVNLNSLDMPPAPRRGSQSVWYEFTGTLRKGPAIIYSLKAD